MNKKHLIAIVVLAVIAGLYFVTSKPLLEQNNNTESPTSSTSTKVVTNEPESETPNNEVYSNNIELDLSKLQGKDRLYTEEEGRYENLSEEERKLIESMICGSEYQSNWLCDDLPESPYTKDIHLVTLREGIAGIAMPSDVSKGMFYIYDIKSKKVLKKYRDSWDMSYGPLYIIHQELTELSVYRPGMKDFIKISESKLDYNHTYLKWIGTVEREFPIDFEGETIVVHVYAYNCEGSKISESTELPISCVSELKEMKTFDLSNLP